MTSRLSAGVCVYSRLHNSPACAWACAHQQPLLRNDEVAVKLNHAHANHNAHTQNESSTQQARTHRR
eukprot:4640646-Pleurochrysis_carterae.AAC.1